MKKIIDAEFEVISGPTPVKWQPARRRPLLLAGPREFDGLKAIQYSFIGLLWLMVLMAVLVELAGGDIDTRDAVAADVARQPVAADLR